MTDPLFTSPEYYFMDFDMEQDLATLVRMTRQTYAASVFLGRRRIVFADRQARQVQLTRLIEMSRQAGTPHRPVGYLFHGAFCGSTLMARFLDLPGRSFSYKEPFTLHQVAGAYRRIARREESADHAARYAQILELAALMLSRTFEPRELPVVKPTDSSNNLIDPLLSYHPGNRGILMFVPLEEFLVATLKSEDRRSWTRNCLGRAQTDAGHVPGLAAFDPASLADAEASAFVWLAQMHLFQEAIARHPDRLRSLNGRWFLDNQGEGLSRTARFLGLDMDEADAGSIVGGIASRTHSKVPGTPFNPDQDRAARAGLAESLAAEIDAGVQWAIAASEGQPMELPEQSRLDQD